MGRESRHNEGVYLTLRSWRIESSKFNNPVMNVATVDVPGVIISTPWRPCKHGLHPCRCCRVHYTGLLTVAVFHIGVGSDVVCSTGLGNARALMRGMDNR